MDDIIKHVNAKTTSLADKDIDRPSSYLVKRMDGTNGDICYIVTNLVNSTVRCHCSVTIQLQASVTTMKEKYLFTRSSCFFDDLLFLVQSHLR